MPAFLWFQKTGGEDAWRLASAAHRAQVIEEVKPAFITVLDAGEVPDDDAWTREDFDRLKYAGPFYADFDSETIEEGIKDLKTFLSNLEDNGVDLESLRLYATGGRGFHIEVPAEVFIVKPAKTGYALYPYILKEIAFELVVDTLDLRVYTGRKGRMWRTPNVQRPNGLYKVAITLDEALHMTPERYTEICEVPRPEPKRATPKFNMYLGTLFDKAKAHVEKQVKSRGKGRKDQEVLSKFEGKFPPTILKLMAGIGLAPGKGFHQIALQLAITANALGQKEEDFVTACEGLVESHQGDSSRYGSPARRREELRRMWHYTSDTPIYEFSVGGIKSLCDFNTTTPDLDDLPTFTVGEDGTLDLEAAATELQEGNLSAARLALLEGMMMADDGFYRRTADGAKQVCNIAFRNPMQLIDLEDKLMVGLEIDIVSDKRHLGRHAPSMQVFKSRASLSEFCTGRSGIFSGSDTQAGVIFLMLARQALKNNDVVHVVRKEGLDIVQNPNVLDKVSMDVIWATSECVLVLHKDDPDVPSKYRFVPKLSTAPVFNADLHKGHKLEATDETRKWMKALLSSNSPLIVAQMLGWFVSCFHKQHYHQAYNQFPLLHPHGAAGSGKSQTTLLMGGLFFVTKPVLMVGCSANATTAFSLKAAWTSSASIPIILDEYKPSELGPVRYDFLLQHFRLLYNQGCGTSGGVNRGGSDSTFRDVTAYSFSAPTVYLGESQEMQTAILQRSVPVAFNQVDSSKYTPNFEIATAGRDNMSRLGAWVLEWSARETLASRKAAIDPRIKMLKSVLPQGVHDRQIYNTAVVMCGLDFLEGVTEHVFGDVFTEDFKRLKDALLDSRDEFNAVAMSESSKVVNDLTHMSRHEASDSEFAIREGYEYLVGDGYVEILLKPAYIKYTAWSSRKGLKPLYTGYESFVGSLAKNPATIDRVCFGSKLKDSPRAKVFRLDTNVLGMEGVEMFSSKSLG